MLRLLEQGCSTKQIAAELHLSTETVRNHIRRLFRALGVNSRLEAVAAARDASTPLSLRGGAGTGWIFPFDTSRSARSPSGEKTST